MNAPGYVPWDKILQITALEKAVAKTFIHKDLTHQPSFFYLGNISSVK